MIISDYANRESHQKKANPVPNKIIVLLLVCWQYNENEELMFESYQKAIDYFAKKNIRLHKAQITRAKKQNKLLFNYYWKGLETISRESRNE